MRLCPGGMLKGSCQYLYGHTAHGSRFQHSKGIEGAQSTPGLMGTRTASCPESGQRHGIWDFRLSVTVLVLQHCFTVTCWRHSSDSLWRIGGTKRPGEAAQAASTVEVLDMLELSAGSLIQRLNVVLCLSACLPVCLAHRPTSVSVVCGDRPCLSTTLRRADRIEACPPSGFARGILLLMLQYSSTAQPADQVRDLLLCTCSNPRISQPRLIRTHL